MACWSARASSASSAAAMPCRRSWAIRARSLSRIVRLPGVQREEVAGDLLEHEVFEAAEVEQAVVQGLFDRGDKRIGRVGSLHLEQTAQCSPRVAGTALFERGGVAVETRMVPAQRRLFGRRAAALPQRDGMVA